MADGVDTVDGRRALIEEFNAVHGCVPALPPDADFDRAACDADRSALCLSGGGIRSAAFAIGVLQALAGQRLLGRFDYLSTVSGGGFAGAWLQRLVLEHGSVPGAEAELRGLEGSAALQGLRGFTSYLTPTGGAFSADTWTGVVLYVRNTLLNWLVFAPFFVFAVLAAILYRTALWAFAPGGALVPLLLGAACLFWGTYSACRFLPSHATARPADAAMIRWNCTVPVLAWTMLAPVAAVCCAAPSLLTEAMRAEIQAVFSGDAAVNWPLPRSFFGLLPCWAELSCLTAAMLLAAYGTAMFRQLRAKDPNRGLFGRNLGVWLATTAVAAGFVAAGALLMGRVRMEDAAGTLAVAGPVWLAVASALQIGMYAGFRESSAPGGADLDREWMARLSAMKLRVALGWGAFTVCCLWLSWFVVDAGAPDGLVPFWAAAINTAVSGPAAAWLGKQAFTRLEGVGRADGKAALPLTRLLQVLAALFAAGLFTLLGGGLGWLLGMLQLSLWPDGTAPLFVFQLGLMCLVLLVGLLQTRRLNVNRFSLHALYRNRLARAFLGTARRAGARKPDPFTGFDAGDNVPLAGLGPFLGEARRLFPVVNMALNLTGDARTQWQERKAASFTATPLRCGSPAYEQDGTKGRYTRTNCYAGSEMPVGAPPPGTHGGLTLATAMTISGAAVSPNWGYHSSPATAFLMTLFNVRLGAWLPNPGTVTDPAELDLAMPRHAALAMLGDLIGQSTATSRAVYLSDGGHFDNLGLYEMLRRRCRTIVVVDAGQDEKCLFEDLGNAIRKAQIDLPGVSIDMGELRLRARGDTTGPAPLGFALGRITYRLEEAGGVARSWTGRLLYVKPSWLGVLPADVRAYGLRSPAFPHESTADQWFSESQFESYRALGQWQMGRIAREARDGRLDSLFEAAEQLAAGVPGTAP